MIYNSNIKLTGNEADRFLESCDVTIYEECIAIDEYEYSYDEAQSILSENGISLYDDCVVLEGEQAEAYKKRKAREKKSAEKEEKSKWKSRYGGFMGPSITGVGLNASDKKQKEARSRKDKALEMVRKNTEHNYEYFNNSHNSEPTLKKKWKKISRDFDYAIDSADRHMRRHPKQYGESASIFSDTNII